MELTDIIHPIQTSKDFSDSYYKKYPRYKERVATSPCCFNYAFKDEQWFMDLMLKNLRNPNEIRYHGS